LLVWLLPEREKEDKKKLGEPRGTTQSGERCKIPFDREGNFEEQPGKTLEREKEEKEKHASRREFQGQQRDPDMVWQKAFQGRRCDAA